MEFDVKLNIIWFDIDPFENEVVHRSFHEVDNNDSVEEEYSDGEVEQV
jgi:hypothetical protein